LTFGPTSQYIRGMAEAQGARVCSVTDALALVGDRYSLLVIREISYGCRRFTDLLEKIGCSRDVLTARLRRLEGVGIVERRRYSDRPQRYEYRLTDSGSELRAIVLALKEWGDAHLNRGKEPVIFAHTCGAEFHARTVCAACGEAADPGELRIIGGTDGVVGTPW
jgi:DNA-binding HxlR family transcriptional regulator